MSRFRSATAGLVLSSLSLSSAPLQADDASIGSAHEKADGTLFLWFRAEADDGSAHGEGEMRYVPGDPDYGSVRHHGAIPRAGEVLVRPFPKAWTEGPAIVPPLDRPPK